MISSPHTHTHTHSLSLSRFLDSALILFSIHSTCKCLCVALVLLIVLCFLLLYLTGSLFFVLFFYTPSRWILYHRLYVYIQYCSACTHCIYTHIFDLLTKALLIEYSIPEHSRHASMHQAVEGDGNNKKTDLVGMDHKALNLNIKPLVRYSLFFLYNLSFLL